MSSRHAFVDRAVVEVSAGDGGSGIEAFRRESGVPLGGPAGGNGGKGGDVIVEVDRQLSTLLDFNYRRHHRADRGRHGEGSNRTGRSGEDLILRVPPGTIVKDADSGEVLGELLAVGDRVIAARGGRGGRGNAAFATATRQAPLHHEPGEAGELRNIEFELKLIADVGLVGEPNAGKSTLLATISEATPRIAAYPFTTLTPQLGVVALADYRSLVVADIPGIIEGAHEGRGLGLRFLRHIERTRVLAYLVPVDSEDPSVEYQRLRTEVHQYSAVLAERPHVLVLTKCDLLAPDAAPPPVVAPDALAVLAISSVARQGLKPMLEVLWAAARAAIEEEEEGRDTSTALPGEEDL